MARLHFGDLRAVKEGILEEVNLLDKEEELGKLDDIKFLRRLFLKEESMQKVREDEIKWKTRSRCQWLKEGDQNTKFFHWPALAWLRGNRILALQNDNVCLVEKEDIIDHITCFFSSLYSKEDWTKPSLDDIAFNSIGEDEVAWLERDFEEDEVKDAVFRMSGEKAPGQDGFLVFFFQRFWLDVKDEIMAFVKGFHARGKLSKNLCATFIALISKVDGAAQLRDFRPISLIGSIHKFWLRSYHVDFRRSCHLLSPPPKGLLLKVGRFGWCANC